MGPLRHCLPSTTRGSAPRRPPAAHACCGVAPGKPPAAASCSNTARPRHPSRCHARQPSAARARGRAPAERLSRARTVVALDRFGALLRRGNLDTDGHIFIQRQARSRTALCWGQSCAGAGARAAHLERAGRPLVAAKAGIRVDDKPVLAVVAGQRLHAIPLRPARARRSRAGRARRAGGCGTPARRRGAPPVLAPRQHERHFTADRTVPAPGAQLGCNRGPAVGELARHGRDSARLLALLHADHRPRALRTAARAGHGGARLLRARAPTARPRLRACAGAEQALRRALASPRAQPAPRRPVSLCAPGPACAGSSDQARSHRAQGAQSASSRAHPASSRGAATQRNTPSASGSPDRDTRSTSRFSRVYHPCLVALPCPPAGAHPAAGPKPGACTDVTLDQVRLCTGLQKAGAAQRCRNRPPHAGQPALHRRMQGQSCRRFLLHVPTPLGPHRC